MAQKVFDQQFATDSKLSLEMDERRKQLMFQDILYNFSFLTTAVNLQDENIFSNYAVWLFELLCNLMKDQMVDHYHVLSLFADELFNSEQVDLAKSYLQKAILVTGDQLMHQSPYGLQLLLPIVRASTSATHFPMVLFPKPAQFIDGGEFLLAEIRALSHRLQVHLHLFGTAGSDEHAGDPLVHQ